MQYFGGTILVLMLAMDGLAVKQSDFNQWQPTTANWNAFKTGHGKRYKDSTEENSRRTIWRNCLQKITQHNTEEMNTGIHGFEMGVNQFCDMTSTEFKAINGRRPNGASKVTRSAEFHSERTRRGIAPGSINWVTKGAVTPVQDQGYYCGSCWAFAATGAVEGMYFLSLRRGTLVNLSEQQLMDCSGAYGNNGCSGGLEYSAYAYYETYYPESSSNYPVQYQAASGTCAYNASYPHIPLVKGIVHIPYGSESAMKTAVGTIGPITAGIDASLQSFQYYSSGVYNDVTCSSTSLDHSVLVVGYGADIKYGDYWLVKNSWGTGWGESGYFRLARNRGNRCGIATDASYPTF